MGFIGIIVAVIIFVLYTARSVEKQNEQSRKRREATGGRRANVSRTDQASEERRPEPVTDGTGDATGQRTRDQGARDRFARSENTGTSSGRRPQGKKIVSGKQVHNMKTGWMKDRRQIRRAFIFSECVGKPRALEPHSFFRKQRMNRVTKN